MRKLGDSINELMAALAAGDDASRKAQRAAAVNVAWRNAVEAVYKDAAQMVLDHVNAVYIMAADEVVKGATTKASHAGTARSWWCTLTTASSARISMRAKSSSR